MTALGTQMKLERERKGITLDDAAQATKISTRFLRAIETEHFDQLPGGIFNKGFIRAYARHLGMDPDEAVTEYLQTTGAEPPPANENEFPLKPPEPPPRRHEQNAADGLSWGVVAAVLLVVALGVSGWRFYSQQRLGKPKHTSSVVLPAANSAGSNTTAQSNTSAPAPATAPSTAEEPALAASQNSSPSDQTALTSAAATNAAGPFTVTVNFREDCWVSVTADGQNLANDVVLIAGTNRSFTAQHELVVKAGNVGGIDFGFNGKPLPRQGDLDEVKTLIFDANGLRPTPSKTEPASNAPSQRQP